MSKESESYFKLYSLGIVVKTKYRGSDYIEVLPIETLPLSNGPIDIFSLNYKVELPNARGVKKATTINGDRKIIARWIPYGHSNRLTPPDVVANETVIILTYADTDEYYWTTIFREPTLRRLETVLYGYSNLASGMEAFDKDSSYWLEVSTHDKHIKLHTSKSNGEPFEYDITIDTEKGYIEAKDSIGNSVLINSSAHQVKMVNASGSTYDMHEGVLDINVPQSVNINTNAFNLNASSVNVSTGSAVISGSSSVAISSPATSIS